MATRSNPDGIFRDFVPGMEGKRADLLRRRRDQLATMPHALRRIFVARASRVAAASMAIIGGTVLIGASIHEGYQQYLATLLPGREPAVLSTILLATLVSSALAYLVGRCVAEARFTRAMSKCVLPTEDLPEDVERLAHVRPDEVASSMIRRFESPAAVLPPAAVGLAGPCILAYLYMAAQAGGYPKEALVDQAITGHSAALFGVAFAGLGAALALALFRNLGALRRTGLVAMGISALAAVGSSLWLGSGTLVALGAFMVGAATVATLATLASEQRTLLSSDDGVQLWTVGRIFTAGWQQLRAAAAWLTWSNIKRLPDLSRTALSTPLGKVAAVAAGACVLMSAYTHWPTADLPPPTHVHATPAIDTPQTVITPTQNSRAVKAVRASSSTRYASNTAEVAVTLTDAPINVHRLTASNGRPLFVPRGWTAGVTVDLQAWGLPEGTVVKLLVGGEVQDQTSGEKQTLKVHSIPATGKGLPIDLVVDSSDSAADANLRVLFIRQQVILHSPPTEGIE